LLLPPLHAEINDLATAVERLYAGMDDSLKFHPENELTSDNSSTEQPLTGQPEVQAHAVKDLRGVLCPMNFVKTKLELAKLTGGQFLQVLLDDGEPIDNVPRSVADEGHRIADQTMIDDYWSVLIEKKM
jgi:sulfite reductase (ferredoxin)